MSDQSPIRQDFHGNSRYVSGRDMYVQITRYAARHAVSVVLAIGFLIALLGFVAWRMYTGYRTDEAIRNGSLNDLGSFSQAVSDLQDRYFTCQKSLEEHPIVAASQLRSDCFVPISKQLAKMANMRDQFAARIEPTAFQEISDLIDLLSNQYTRIYIAESSTRSFEEECVRAMILLCHSRHKNASYSGLDYAKKEGQEALTWQMYAYFVVRDFIGPELNSIKAHLAVLSRSVNHEAIPENLVASAKALPGLLKDMAAYHYRSGVCFRIARTKAWLSRDFKAPDDDEDFDNQLWNDYIIAAVVDGVRGHADQVEELINCHVLNEKAKALEAPAPEYQ